MLVVLHLDPNPESKLAAILADVFLTSLAVSYGHGALAVILSGAGHDGAARAAALRLAGGTVVAQDGETSEYFGMSGAAIEEGAVDLIEPLREIGSAVVGFARA